MVHAQATFVVDGTSLAAPSELTPNPENPRLIFRQDELQALQDSIDTQGVLVPLTVYRDRKRLVILDGERRWRCAVKLALPRVPVVIQPKPDKLQNLMMMFAIHNSRKEWDPLPTAYKLQELEKEFARRQGRAPSELELSEIASLNRGEIRRLKNLLALPADYRQELIEELEKPTIEQVITADVVLEATRGAAALRKRNVVNDKEEDQLRRAIIDKYRTKVVASTVAPRQLARIARAVERKEVSATVARTVTKRLISQPGYSIDAAFKDSVARIDFEHSIEVLAIRLEANLKDHTRLNKEVGPALAASLKQLSLTIQKLLG